MGQAQARDRILTAVVEYPIEQKTTAPNSALSLAMQTWASVLNVLLLKFLICLSELSWESNGIV